MKKTYLNPTTTVVNIELANIIAASPANPEGFNGSVGTQSVDGSAGLSRQSNFSVWGDDEEENY